MTEENKKISYDVTDLMGIGFSLNQTQLIWDC